MTSSAGQKANRPISPGVIQRMSWCSRSCGTPERMEAFKRVTFADQSLFLALSRLHLAADKFPQRAARLVAGTLAD